MLCLHVRLEAGSAVPLRTRLADIRSHVRPVVREGELLGDQRLQDLAHEPPAGAHARPPSGPQRAAAPDQPVTVSTPLTSTPTTELHALSLSACPSTQLSIPPRSEAVEVAVETRGGPETDIQPGRRGPALLRQQRALLPKAWSIMGKIRGEGKANGCGEGGAEHRAGGETRTFLLLVQVFVSLINSILISYLVKICFMVYKKSPRCQTFFHSSAAAIFV